MDTLDINRPIFAPVILGTPRQGRASEYAAHFVVDYVAKRPDVRTDLIDIRNIRLSIDDAGEAIKDPKFSATVNEADALIFVVPEYNHSFPGLLKHVLDTNLKEDIRQGGWRLRRFRRSLRRRPHDSELLPVLRELGLVTIFWDVYFGSAGKLFDTSTGQITDSAYAGRLDKFLNELVWMARALRYARENISA